MNFFCDKCKQKYHVADDKVRGRAVTRFRCKKCDNIIELQGNALPPESGDPQSFTDGAMAASVFPGTGSGPTPVVATAPASPVGPPAAPAAPRRARPATTTVPAASALGPTAPRSVNTPPAPTAPIGPAAVARAPMTPAPRQRAATTTGPAFGSAGFSAPRAAGNAAMPARNPAPIAARAEPQKSPSTSSILNASETGWYAGIRDLPVGPLTRKELSARVQAGDVTPDTLVWREGLDDWRPLRGVDELGDLLRIAAQQMSGNLLDEMGKRPPSTPPPPERSKGAQVVPIGAARATSAVAARNAPSVPPPAADDDDEATKVSGMSSALAAQIAATKPIAKAVAPTPPARTEPTPARKPTHAPPPAPGPVTATVGLSPSVFDDPPALNAFQAQAQPPAPTGIPSSRPQPAPQPMTQPSPMTPTSPMAQPVGPAPYSFDAPPPPTQRPMSVPVPIAQPVTPSVAPVHEKQRPGGLPLGAWILMGGIGVSGILGGILIGRHNTTAVTVLPPTPAPAPPHAAPTVAEPLPLPEAVPVVAPTPPVAAADAGALVVAANTNDNNSHGGHSAHTPRTPTAPALTPEQLRLLRETGGPTGVAGGPVGSTQLRVSQTGANQNTGSTSASRGPAILNAFRTSRVADTCWQSSLRINPALGQRPTRVTVTIGVASTGRFSEISVQNSPDPSFDTCLRNRLRNIPALSPGEAMSAETSINLSAGG